MEFIKINLKELIDRYNSGESTRSLAKLYNTSKATIRNKLIKNNIKIRSSNEQIKLDEKDHKLQSKPNNTLTENKLKQLWGTKSVSAIAAETDTTLEKVQRMAYSLGLKKIKINWKYQTWWNNKEWLYDQYINKELSLNKISELAESTPETIKEKLISYGITIRTLKESVAAWNNKHKGNKKC